MNLYEILGVERGSTPVAIKAAFRKRSKDLHPDTGGSNEAFAKLSSAYMVLRDKARRARYDETGEVDKGKVDSDLKKLASMLLALFNNAIQEGFHFRKDLDVIKLMRQRVKGVVKKKEEEIQEISDELTAIQALADRISSRDTRNLLGSVIEDKKRALEHFRVSLSQELRLIKMLEEELGNYSCLVEVARTVQMYFTGEVTTSSTSSSF